jgi:DNA-binding beta-propeller fold protein YncE
MRNSQYMSALAAIIFTAGSIIAASGLASAAPNGKTYHQIASIPLPGAEGFDYLSVDAAGRRLYVTRGSHVALVDIDSNKPAGEITGLGGVHGVAIDDADGLGFITDGQKSNVVTFDLKTLAILRTSPTGNGADGIVYDPFSHRVFSFNGHDKSATAIDAKTGAVAGTIALPGRPEFPATDGAGHIFDNIEDQNEIVSINASTLAIDATWPTAPGESVSGLAIDVKSHRLFSTAHNNKLIVVDSKTGKVVATPAIGNGPDAVVFDPASKLIFVPDGRDGSITIIKESSPDKYDVIDTVKTKAGARTIAIDTKTHQVYTVTADQAPAPVGDNSPRRRRGYIDGTFTVLVYGP